MPAELEILYRDEHIVAINKPAGLLVHQSPIDRYETRFAVEMVRELVGGPAHPVHRLDKPTSGVLLFAFSAAVTQKLSLQFQENRVTKEYLAIVRGYTPENRLIDYPLKQMLDTQAQKRQGITKEPQSAQTYYERLATVELPFAVSRYPTARYSLLKLSPKTGRKHQLRRHMKHDMHPIVGDTKHGRGEHNKLFRAEFDVHRMLLHASLISFEHPVSGEAMRIEAPLDANFERLFERFGWKI